MKKHSEKELERANYSQFTRFSVCCQSLFYFSFYIKMQEFEFKIHFPAFLKDIVYFGMDVSVLSCFHFSGCFPIHRYASRQMTTESSEPTGAAKPIGVRLVLSSAEAR